MPKNYSFWALILLTLESPISRLFDQCFLMGFLDRGRKLKLRVGIYARVSTQDQQTLPLQLEVMRKYAKTRKWPIILEIKDIGSGVKDRERRELLMQAARRREIDAVIVWKLDRWGRSLHDLISTLKELSELEVGFISLTEALDLTTAIGRAMAGVLAVFAEFEREMLKERVKAGIAQARKKGKNHGRPRTVTRHKVKIKELFSQGLSKAEIARRLKIGRTSVIRLLAD
jgi:putative DNA-invertase from lambdoid prophage Rac